MSTTVNNHNKHASRDRQNKKSANRRRGNNKITHQKARTPESTSTEGSNSYGRRDHRKTRKRPSILELECQDLAEIQRLQQEEQNHQRANQRSKRKRRRQSIRLEPQEEEESQIDLEDYGFEKRVIKQLMHVIEYAEKNNKEEITFIELKAIFLKKHHKASFGEYVQLRKIESELARLFELMQKLGYAN